MKKVSSRFLLVAGVICLAVSWMFLGVFQHREFARNYFVFVKHRPSPKIFFYAPLGESDRTIESLPARFQKEERAFDEFVYRGGGFFRKLNADIVEAILLVLFVVGWVSLWRIPKPRSMKKEPNQSLQPTAPSRRG